MFSLVKAKAAEYFGSKSPPLDLHSQTKTHKDRRHFYTFLVAHHLK